jgi:excisionase family DNA binding protein
MMNTAKDLRLEEESMPAFNDRYYRPDEIAEALKVDRTTVYRMIKDVLDPLPAYRVNDRGPLRVHGNDINRYLEKHKVQPENE